MRLEREAFMSRRGPWKIEAERLAYDNPWVSLREYEVLRPDGAPGLYGVLEPKHIAVGVVPVFADGTTVLVGQYRFALDAYSWELPEGGGPLGEDPLETARRELAEETGLVADRWRELIGFDVSNSVTNERAVGYLAWELSEGKPHREGSEADMVMKRIALQDALEMAMSGRIRDGFTIVMLSAADHLARSGALDAGLARAILSRP